MPTNTDELRALDRRVAEVVMGRPTHDDGTGCLSMQATDEIWDPIPTFSADTPEGWAAIGTKLAPEMLKRGLVLNLCRTWGPDGRWYATFNDGYMTYPVGEGDSGPEAASNAACAALEATDAVE